MRRITFPILAVALCLTAPVAAHAASTDTILRDCVDGQIDGDYSRADLERARRDIPSDVEEYSDCRGAIDQARIDASAGSGSSGGGAGSSGGGSSGGGSSGGGSSGGASSGGASSSAGGSSGAASPGQAGSVSAANAEPSDPQGPAETNAVDEARLAGGGSVRLSPETLVRPGSSGLPAGEALRRSVPDPLLVVLILLGAVVLVGVVLGARARVVARRLP